MPIEFRCTECGRALQAGDATAGTRILCPGCGTFSAVPSPSAGHFGDRPDGREAGPPIEFRCTGCNKLLRTAADTAGKQAKCPECGRILPVPAPGAGVPGETLPYTPPPPPPSEEPASPFAPGGPEPAAPGDPENPYLAPTQYGQPPPQPFTGSAATAASRVAGPAIALIVTGGLGIAAQVVGLIVNLAQVGWVMPGGGPNQMPVFFSGGVAVVTGMINLLVGIVVIVGAVKMKNLESYGFAMASAIVAMVPCISPCCLLGLPFGIWSLVVLSDAGVKAAFRA